MTQDPMEYNALPVTSFAPVLISAKYFVFGEKSCSGSNIAVLLSGLRDKTPFIRVDSPSSAGIVLSTFGGSFSEGAGAAAPAAFVTAAVVVAAAAVAFSVADSAALVPK